MPTKRARYFVSLGAGSAARLEALAKANSVTPGRMASIIVEQHLADQTDECGTSGVREAEQILLHWVRDRAREAKRTDKWGPDVTAAIFDMIATQAADLYAAAVTRSNRDRLHREIAALVRQELGATIKSTVAGPRRARAKPGNLIQSYTLLFRSQDS